MSTDTVQKGIGAAFHVNAETKAMRGLFSELRNVGIQTIDPLDAHITLVDCAETQISVFSERDQLALNQARAEASRYLATMPFFELVLSPGEPQLQVFGRRLGIFVAEQEYVRQVRSYVGDIFQEEAGIPLSNRNYIAHLSVGLKSRGLGSAARRVGHARVPRNIHVSGHDVSERIFFEDPTRQRAHQLYTNRRLRAVS